MEPVATALRDLGGRVGIPDAILARADPDTVGRGVKTGTELLRRRETMPEDVVKLKPFEKSVIL